ncbi:MAG: anaerobic ribonucleoside-triphosphate reductase activating protein [Treponema sp.]|nr:anaerobic ribonucleoside-triphosphate reductase activating protein [Treponema sp.]
MNVLLRKTSLVDYPEKIASVIFFAACNLRCPWCHNRELVLSCGEEVGRGGWVSLDQALAHIRKRRSMLGGVVLSGGEPTLYTKLTELIVSIKDFGLPVKLDTNGMNPSVLETLLRKAPPDYIALDLKLAPDRYAELFPPSHTAGAASAEQVGLALKQSAALIRDSVLTHEFRTLALPNVDETDIDALAPLVDEALWSFRAFSSGNCLDPIWNTFADSSMADVNKLVKRARELGKNAVGGNFGGEGN